MPSDLYAVIADPTRRQLLSELAAGERSVGYLVEAVGVSQPTVSKHLRVLRDAQLVSIRAQGQKRFYALESGPLREVVEWVATLLPHPEAPEEEAKAVSEPHGVGQVPESSVGTEVASTPGAELEHGELDAAGLDAAGRRGNGVGRTMEQVTGRAQELLDRLAKQRFGRRR
ncbi:ArsR/SmtB family transcription factor [Galactobacter caseinivorans]|uniref:ArsR family transcriptional regulator n=1 Tax=Galactobacter caseinivorans TaxID=2676123 RepID=A0A496PLC0_9MICC|nr:metalloregulator ArsR/SmtB family transcription factor [Galactobacter caseinivorans]RKW71341.1 ArsR family transcriptional regulator [Galactobacter caseinivorans]